MIIDENHLLTGVKFDKLPDGGSMPVRRFLVHHFTGGWADSVEVMRERGVSVQFVVKRDGTIVQCVPCNRIAFHAGKSKWRDPKTGREFVGLNNCSIGIEIENIGDLQRATYPKPMGDLAGKPIPRLKAAHPYGGPLTSWETYPEVQLAAVEALSKVIVVRYNLDDLVGHQDISPGRKNDPGPAYPLNRMRKACGFAKPISGYPG